MTQANTVLEPKRHAKPRSGQAAKAARPNGGAAAAARVDPASFRDAILAKLTYSIGKDPSAARDHDWFAATALAVRDHVIDRWMDSTRATYQREQKRVYYLSLEFLIGRLLFDALGNLGLARRPRARRSPGSASTSTASRETEPDAALGNGGLGRLAACFMESMASLEVPAYGYGIRYDHGLFRQTDRRRLAARAARGLARRRQPLGVRAPRGRLPDRLRRLGRACRRATASSSASLAARARRCSRSPTTRRSSAGAAATSTRCGCGRRAPPTRCSSRPSTAATMSARSPHRARAEAISRVLYPSDATPAGQELRLRQEYFFTSASLQDLVRRHLQQYGDAAQPAAEQVGDPAQRHPSGDRGRRADAAPRRRARLAWDEAWADHHRRPSATPTTRCCRRRWRPGRCRCWSGCCRATCRSST